mmetsp:Transcript_13483/g.42105  ORF Transcript_13483/g.42105 Transcript_13483/m.42105 type:complete len:355 (-) Transcript_13483:956-2020(-)
MILCKVVLDALYEGGLDAVRRHAPLLQPTLEVADLAPVALARLHQGLHAGGVFLALLLLDHLRVRAASLGRLGCPGLGLRLRLGACLGAGLRARPLLGRLLCVWLALLGGGPLAQDVDEAAGSRILVLHGRAGLRHDVLLGHLLGPLVLGRVLPGGGTLLLLPIPATAVLLPVVALLPPLVVLFPLVVLLPVVLLPVILLPVVLLPVVLLAAPVVLLRPLVALAVLVVVLLPPLVLLALVRLPAVPPAPAPAAHEVAQALRHLLLRLLHDRDDVCRLLLVAPRGQECVGVAHVAGTACPADAVNVPLRVVGRVVVHDGGDVPDVQATRCDVRGDEDPNLARAEPVQRGVPRPLV